MLSYAKEGDKASSVVCIYFVYSMNGCHDVQMQHKE